jgi:AmiR/NasT family two-component response regulator
VGHAGATLDEAFEALRRHARNHNLKLAVVAGDVVHRKLAPGTLIPRGQDQ